MVMAESFEDRLVQLLLFSDGDRPQTAIKVQRWLLDKFGGNFWTRPPRSPDLNPCDLFLLELS